MSGKVRFPLLAKVLGWLFLHLLILTLAFVAFVAWQLRLGLDSLLSGSAGDRLRVFGETAREQMMAKSPPEWNSALEPLASAKGFTAALFDYSSPDDFPLELPPNVRERLLSFAPPPLPARRPPPRFDGPPDGPPEGFGGFPEDGPRPDRRRNGPPGGMDNRREPPLNVPTSKPLFLVRGEDGKGYWAGIQLLMPAPASFGQPYRLSMLMVRADRLDGSGMFFDFKPWLWGGLGVLALSLAFWTPFVWGITRYVRRLTVATGRIAAGDFHISLPPGRNDELGMLGHSIDSMASRLDHLIAGQKRFLGDAAHELCAPLARLRTGIGILEMKLGAQRSNDLLPIEAEAQELATLIEEILAFSRTGNREPVYQIFLLEPLIREIAARETGMNLPEINIPEDLTIYADASLIGRAVGNLLRNARIHAGPAAVVSIEAAAEGEWTVLHVTDDGPGVASEELPRLFEPFYRPDRSRSRDTGGSGLGLSIVRTAVEACGGTTSASLPESGGFRVTLHLRRAEAVTAAPAF